jgi:hypothetical protein
MDGIVMVWVPCHGRNPFQATISVERRELLQYSVQYASLRILTRVCDRRYHPAVIPLLRPTEVKHTGSGAVTDTKEQEHFESAPCWSRWVPGRPADAVLLRRRHNTGDEQSEEVCCMTLCRCRVLTG